MWNKSGSNYHECGQAGRICVCKLCNCGYHKCPAKHTSVHTHYDKCMKWEYGAKFREWPMPKWFVRDHPAPANSNARLDCNTTCTDNFVKHPFGPRESMCPIPRVEITVQCSQTQLTVWTIGTSPRTCKQGKKWLLKLTMAVASSVETLLTMWILGIVVRVLQL